MSNNRYIVLYADEFGSYVWKQYCKTLGVSSDSLELKVIVKDVIVLDEEESEDE